MATYIDIWRRVARTAGYPSAVSDFQNGKGYCESIKTWIDESNKKNAALAPAKDKTATISTTSGVAEYDLPTDFAKMVEMWYLQGTRKIQIFQLGRDEFLNLESVVSSAIQFLYYTIRKDDNQGVPFNKVAIYPAAQSNGLTIYYRYQLTPPALVTDPAVNTGSSTVLIAPPGFEEMDTYFALKELYLQRENPASAREYKALYDEQFVKFKDYVGNPNRDLVVKKGVLPSINPNLYPVLTGY